jgi:hypothetical protein
MGRRLVDRLAGWQKAVGRKTVRQTGRLADSKWAGRLLGQAYRQQVGRRADWQKGSKPTGRCVHADKKTGRRACRPTTRQARIQAGRRA